MLAAIQGHLERIYRLELPVQVEQFLISRETCLSLLGEPAGPGALVVQQERADQIRVGVYIDEEALSTLEGDNPTTRLTAANFASFCLATEEVSHFAYLMFSAGQGRPVTQLELELQAEVDKFITATLLLARQNGGLVPAALLDRLFGDFALRPGLDAGRSERYRAASAFARSYCASLIRSFLRPARLAELMKELRHFYRLSQPGKVGHIHRMAFAA